MTRKTFEALRREIEGSYPGVRADFEPGNHHRMTLHYRGRSRFVIIPGSPSDRRNFQNTLRDARRELRNLGVQA